MIKRKKQERGFKSIFQRKNSGIFFLFLCLSTLLWLVVKFSAVHVTTTSFRVAYINFPQYKTLLSKPPKTVDAIVESTGFMLVYNHFKNKEKVIDLSEIDSTKGSFITAAQLQKQLNRQLLRTQVKQVLLDTLKFNFSTNSRKMVRIKPKFTISFEQGFGLYDSVRAVPAKIWVEGPKEIIDTITVIHTQPVDLKLVRADVEANATVSLNGPLKNLVVQTSTVSVRADVERFSEKKIKVPVQMVNNPPQYKVTLLPAEVEVVCKVAMRDIGYVTPDDFKLICDYNNRLDNSPYLLLELVKKPPFVKHYTLGVDKVEYLMQQQ